jgi:sigma-E factor negative regulatory protein RseA
MNEKISALVDGELDGQSLDVLKDAQAREAWATYHLIGDTMRNTPELSSDFSARLAWRLEDEPTVLAPRNIPAQPRRWLSPMPIAASLAAVTLVGWLAFAPQQPVPVSAPVAKVEERKPAPVAIVPLPASTNDYLLAHQGFSPRLQLQGMAPYVITVSEQPRK